MRLLLVVLLLAPISLPSKSHEVLEGWVSDSACGVRHVKPGAENCVRLCIRGGGTAHPEWKAQKMVLIADSDGKIWTIANPAGLVGFEGRHVRVSVDRRRAQLFVHSAVIARENKS